MMHAERVVEFLEIGRNHVLGCAFFCVGLCDFLLQQIKRTRDILVTLHADICRWNPGMSPLFRSGMAEAAIDPQLTCVQSMRIGNRLLRSIALLIVRQTPYSDAGSDRCQSDQEDDCDDALWHDCEQS